MSDAKILMVITAAVLFALGSGLVLIRLLPVH